MEKKLSRKTLIAVASVALIAAFVIGGTLAWIIATDNSVVNTFTYGDISIDLSETDTGDNDGNYDTNTYELVPGRTVRKDPKVTVAGGSEDSILFVKLEKSDNYDDFMEDYAIGDGWAALDQTNYPGVYYRMTSKSDADQEYEVIKDSEITMKTTVTKAQLNALDADPANPTYPTLTVTAYAVQQEGIVDAAKTDNENALAAWEIANP